MGAGEGAPIPVRRGRDWAHGPDLVAERRSGQIRQFPALQPKANAKASAGGATISTELADLKQRNQWLQYAVAGFAAWSVAATYTAVTYQGEDRAGLENQILKLKSGLFDFQSANQDVLEVAYRNTEGSRSFAQISDMLALNEVQPDFDEAALAAAQADQQQAPMALLAHPHPATIADEAAPAPSAKAPSATKAPKKNSKKTAGKASAATQLSQLSYSAGLKLPEVSQPFGLPPQYSLRGEVAQNVPGFDRLASSLRLPITPLAAKLAPISVAALSLSGKSPKTVKVNSYRHAPRRRTSASTALAARQRRATVGSVQIKAFQDRGKPAPLGRQFDKLSNGLVNPAAASGDVAKLVVP